jgi:hypothetical protein
MLLFPWYCEDVVLFCPFASIILPNGVCLLCFASGHTFCSCCLEMHKKKNPRGYSTVSYHQPGVRLQLLPSLLHTCRYTCPYCRSEITSEAINHSLKHLIEDFTGIVAAFHTTFLTHSLTGLQSAKAKNSSLIVDVATF